MLRIHLSQSLVALNNLSFSTLIEDKTLQFIKTIKTIGEATFEKLGSDLAGPIIDEAKRELGLGSFLGSRDGISSKPKEIGQEELKREVGLTKKEIEKVIREFT